MNVQTALFALKTSYLLNNYANAWPTTAFPRWRELQKMPFFLVKRLESGYNILYHKTCYKKLTRRLYQINENMEDTSGNEESAIFDRSFDTLASEIEQHLLEPLKVATMLELKTRFCQFLSNEGIVASNYKSLYLQKKTRKTLRKQTFILAIKIKQL